MANDSLQHTNTIEQVYAQALLELAETQNQVDAVRDELGQIKALLDSEPGLAKLMDSRVLRSETLADSVQKIFQDKISDLTYRFLQVLNAKQRLSILPGVMVAFGQLVEAKHGIVEVQAYIAAELNPEQVKHVADRIGQVLHKQVTLQQHIDPSLIGGLKLRVGDQLIDGSVATQLKILQSRIATQGREMARQIANQTA